VGDRQVLVLDFRVDDVAGMADCQHGTDGQNR
jgi:hypothetical protein